VLVLAAVDDLLHLGFQVCSKVAAFYFSLKLLSCHAEGFVLQMYLLRIVHSSLTLLTQIVVTYCHFNWQQNCVQSIADCRLAL